MRGPKSVSLLWKILFSTSIAITVLFAVFGWIVQDQFVRIASNSLEQEVRSSFRAYDSLWNARTEQLRSVGLVLSRMPDVRAAFTTGDPATIRDSAGEVWEQVARRRGLFLVTDPRGGVVAALGGRPSKPITDVPEVRNAAALFPRQATGFMFYDNRLYRIVVTPVYVASSHGPALINVLVAGFAVDADLARELHDATGDSEFVFLVRGRVIASTLDVAQAAKLASFQGNGPVTLDGSEYVQYVSQLFDTNDQPFGELRILRSFDAARSSLTDLRTRIVILWGVGIAAGLALTYALARRLLRPVQALDNAAAEIGKGNYNVQVSVESRDEVGRLAATFNAMCASIREARAELIRQERISTISRLSTSIIHDLRNPLAAIYGGSEMMVDAELSVPQMKRLAQNIYRSSRRVQELLQELASVTGGRPHARESCRLREVVLAARQMIAPGAEARHVEVRIDVDDQIELSLDRSRMERVFQNLMINAVEAMPNGGKLTVTARRHETGVLLTVEDTGPGVPKSIQQTLFQPFVSAGKKNGIGLGLALSRQTVLDHGGDLWLDSGVSEGAKFWIRLPA